MSASMPIEELRDEFAARGVVAISKLLSPSEVELLRSECSQLRTELSDVAIMDSACTLEIPLPSAAAARTDPHIYMSARSADPAVRASLSNLILAVLPSAVSAVQHSHDSGTAADHHAPPFLFNEHYILKPALVAGPFCWHSDAAHQLEALLALAPPSARELEADAVGASIEDYVSLWIPMDDITEDNGALILLPRDAAAGAPAWHEQANDAIEAWFQTHGLPASLSASGLRAGDAVLFSSRVWHCSEANRSDHDRRVYYAQFSRAPVMSGAGGGARGRCSSPLSLALPTTPDPSAAARLEPAQLSKLARPDQVAAAAVAGGRGGDAAESDCENSSGDRKRRRGTSS